MKKHILSFLTATQILASPEISNINIAQIEGTRLVHIVYDLAFPGFLSLKVKLQISKDGGNTWTVPVSTNGAIGSDITPGYRKVIIWDAYTDNPGEISTVRFRITADNEFMVVPAGSVRLGATSGDEVREDPQVNISTSAFYIHQTEISAEKWNNVRIWALNNGYSDMLSLSARSDSHPVDNVDLASAVQWCNARSEREGLTPAYYKSGSVARTRSGYDTINWNADGYRLPTEAEWEKAARGGVFDKRYPWGTDNISHSEANYRGGGTSYGNLSPNGFHPEFSGWTSPVGRFAPNPYGLYDMAGNVSELCHSLGYNNIYPLAEGTNNPRPSDGSTSFVFRGGGARSTAYYCRASMRPFYDSYGLGFRPIRALISGKSSPEITNASVTNIKQHEANFVGNVISDGGATIIERGFVYSSEGSENLFIEYPGVTKILAATINNTPNNRSFSSTIKNLKINTDYYVKSYAINHQGVTYSPTHQFKTLPAFILVPEGSFKMGRVLIENDSDAPQVSVFLSAYYMQYTETSKEEWDEVRNWALSNGYLDLSAGSGKLPTHPVQSITWWDAVKWCNAKSERDGLTPVYTVSGEVMRQGQSEQTPDVDWLANGYRLPTEAEWEKASRGGLVDNIFPLGNVIGHSLANYYGGNTGYKYDAPDTRLKGYHPQYSAGSYPYTSPVGSFPSNGYNLFDMTGNVFEFCWDIYSPDYYTSSSNNRINPKGPSTGSGRVVRGGSWDSSSFYLRCHERSSIRSIDADMAVGFRTVRSFNN